MKYEGTNAELVDEIESGEGRLFALTGWVEDMLRSPTAGRFVPLVKTAPIRKARLDGNGDVWVQGASESAYRLIDGETNVWTSANDPEEMPVDNFPLPHELDVEFGESAMFDPPSRSLIFPDTSPLRIDSVGSGERFDDIVAKQCEPFKNPERHGLVWDNGLYYMPSPSGTVSIERMHFTVAELLGVDPYHDLSGYVYGVWQSRGCHTVHIFDTPTPIWFTHAPSGITLVSPTIDTLNTPKRNSIFHELPFGVVFAQRGVALSRLDLDMILKSVRGKLPNAFNTRSYTLMRRIADMVEDDPQIRSQLAAMLTLDFSRFHDPEGSGMDPNDYVENMAELYREFAECADGQYGVGSFVYHFASTFTVTKGLYAETSNYLMDWRDIDRYAQLVSGIRIGGKVF